MKILTVLGSPRKKGNTAALLDQYVKGVKDNYPEAELNHLHLEDKSVRGCKGCWSCQSGKVENCVIKDDMIAMYDHILEADLIVLATPIYTFSMTAQMKAFADRLFAVAGKLRGKKVVTLTVYGDTNIESSGARNHLNVIESLCNYTGMRYQGNYEASSGYMPVSSNQKVLDEVYTLGLNFQ